MGTKVLDETEELMDTIAEKVEETMAAFFEEEGWFEKKLRKIFFGKESEEEMNIADRIAVSIDRPKSWGTFLLKYIVIGVAVALVAVMFSKLSAAFATYKVIKAGGVVLAAVA